jgi:hypothetical protein
VQGKQSLGGKTMNLKCWFCGTWFPEGGEQCMTCNWHKCPYCKKCYCDLSKEGQRVAETMNEQYIRASD